MKRSRSIPLVGLLAVTLLCGGASAAETILTDGDFAGSSMAEVIENSTGKLSDEDIAAIATYLRSVPAIRNK